MKHLFFTLVALCSLLRIIRAQKHTATVLPCALNCFDQHSRIANCASEDADCLCTNLDFQAALTTCVAENCAVREDFLLHSITGNLCGWPYRDRSARFRNVCVFLLATATLFVGARIVARLPMFRGPLGYDDYLILIIWALLVCHVTLVWKGRSGASDSSLKVDIRTVPTEKVTLTLIYFSVLEWIYYTVIWATKVSILLLYLRLFPNEDFRRAVKVGLVACSVAGFGFLIASIFQCFPVSFNWTFWDGEHAGKCTNIVVQGWVGIIVNIVADIAVLTLPLPTIWKLNLALEKRLSTMAMFGVGLFVTGVSIVRVTQYARIGNSFNETWGLDEPGLWSALEMYVGVVCACMPGMRNFYTRVVPTKRIVEFTSTWRRSKAFTNQPTNFTDTIGSKGCQGRNSRPNRDCEFSTATEDFEDPRLWQQEFERNRRDSEFELVQGVNCQEWGDAPWNGFRNEVELIRK